MINYKNELLEQLNEIVTLKAMLEKKLKRSRGTEKGSLRVTTSHGIPQYYYKKDGNAKGEYIPSANRSKVKEIVQREYDEKVLAELSSSEKKLKKFLNSYEWSNIDETYEKLCKGRKDLVTPVVPTKRMKISAWYEQNKGAQNTYEIKNPFQTANGEMVRSKSEKILADLFKSMNIPYIYEPRIILHDGRTVYPDFALYNYKNGDTIYWEHLGLADDTDYSTRNNKKIIAYEKSGLIVGVNLVLSYESAEVPLDVKIIKQKLEGLFR
jgi:hypothetical protein